MMSSLPDQEAGNAIVQQSLRDTIASILKNTPIEPKKSKEPFTTSNAEILKCRADAYPKSLHEFNPEEWWLRFDLEKGHGLRDYFLYIQNYGFLTEVRHSGSLHNGLLPLDSPAAQHDVWILCRTRCTAIEAVRHWSLFTQGYLFHLWAGKEKKPNATVQTGISEQEICNTDFVRRLMFPDKEFRTDIELRVVDLLQEENRRETNHPHDMPKERFIAYHVGRTAYSWTQIYTLSNAIIKQMRDVGTYNWLENNCQHFVLSLMRRVVMTQRKGIAICGTREQIARMDLGDQSLQLVPWLTKAKACILLLPVAKSLYMVETNHWYSRLKYRPHNDWGWPRWADSVAFKRSWQAILRNITNAQGRDRIELFKAECKKHFGGHQGWAEMDARSYALWYGVMMSSITVLTEGIEMLLSMRVAGAAASIGAEAAAAAAASAEFASIATVACSFALYIVFSRMMLARGSLTQRHYDIKTLEQAANQTCPNSPELFKDIYLKTRYYGDPLIRAVKNNGEKGVNLRELGNWGKKADHYLYKRRNPTAFKTETRPEYQPPLPPRPELGVTLAPAITPTTYEYEAEEGMQELGLEDIFSAVELVPLGEEATHHWS